ncbi:phage tail protein [Paracoccus pantotrophus]|nr:phage tail protein [Paracoccus pantotrophus]
MAVTPVKATTTRSKKMFVRLSNGAEPPVFIAPCGFTEKSFNRSKTFGETVTPYCEGGDDIVDWVERDTVSMTASISGQGVMARQSVPTWEAALASADSIECEVEIEWPDGSKELYTGRFHVESLEIGSPEGQRVTSNVSMQSDGPVEYERVPA